MAALDPTQRASVVQQAQDIATKYGISPEMALWNYANQNGIDPAGIDSYMGVRPRYIIGLGGKKWRGWSAIEESRHGGPSSST